MRHLVLVALVATSFCARLTFEQPLEGSNYVDIKITADEGVSFLKTRSFSDVNTFSLRFHGQNGTSKEAPAFIAGFNTYQGNNEEIASGRVTSIAGTAIIGVKLCDLVTFDADAASTPGGILCYSVSPLNADGSGPAIACPAEQTFPVKALELEREDEFFNLNMPAPDEVSDNSCGNFQ